MRSTAALFTAGGQQPGRFFFARAAWQRRKQEVAAVQELVLLKALFQRALPEALQGVLPVAHLEMLPIRIGRPPRGTLPPSDATLERRPPCITTVWNFRFSQASIICPRGELFPTLGPSPTSPNHAAPPPSVTNDKARQPARFRYRIRNSRFRMPQFW